MKFFFAPFLFYFLSLSINSLNAQTTLIIISDGSWKSSINFTSGWETVGFNDTSWINATSPAPIGCTPVISGTQSMWSSSNNDINVYFRKTFSLSTSSPTTATVELTADNEFTLYLNGIYVGTGDDWSVFYTFNIAPYLNNGTNVFAIYAKEWDPGTCNQVTFKATINYVPLPITLLDFHALCKKSKVNVEWKTSSEINNDYFTIERSRDDLDFNAIGTMAGAGNSTKILSYSFTDERPLDGSSYYRLKQTDFDGKCKSFDIASVKCGNDLIEATVYPNPTTGVFNIRFRDAQYEEALQMKVFNIMGEEMHLTKSGEAPLQFLLDAPPGIYLLKINNDLEVLIVE